MGIIKKATPRKSEIKVIPDEKDGTLPYIEKEVPEKSFVAMEEADADEKGQLALDVFQTADEIVVVAPIAGVTMDDISIMITDDEDRILTIEGRRDLQFRADQSDYFTQECFWGSFSRSIILPEAVDTSKVEASFKKAILTIKIPKIEKIRSRTVKIKEE